jgi:hypothetical protein
MQDDYAPAAGNHGFTVHTVIRFFVNDAAVLVH